MSTLYPPHDTTKWWNFSVRFQIFATACFATGMYLILSLNVAPTLGQYERILSALWHETGHAAVAAIGSGEVKDIEVHANGSGHAVAVATSELHQLAISFAGILTQALIGALCLYVGATRSLVHGLLVVWTAVCLAVCYYFVTETAVQMTLYSVGSGTLLLALLPVHAWIKAPFLLLLGFVMTHGVIDSVPYAFDTAKDGNPPTDSDRIAAILDLGVDEVGRIFVGLIIIIYLVTAALISNFVGRNA